ncbi:MAG TPA: alpha-galactosidase [Candidatus Sulfotelmatobacter sp.]|nr:alpha-galactosidase [Candidatus Sulfotelmatobacter sp.]
MTRRNGFAFSIAILLTAASLSWAQTVTVAKSGWTVSADQSLSQLAISADKLGVVMQNVRLNLYSGEGLTPATMWTAEVTGENQLSIKTRDSRVVWIFELHANELRISSTSLESVLTGQAPAASQRIIARLMDREGTPVDWVGTGEVAVSYSGSYTHNPSFLPRRNADCAYFALGQVSGAGIHSLFDRPSDIAIDFPEEATLSRDAQNLDILDVTLPVPGNTLVRLIPDYFTKSLGLPFYVPYDDSHFSTAPMVWSSWTSYYERVKEEDIVRNADWIAAHLLAYGFQFVQLDDGYDRGPDGRHFWITNWDQQRFPHGPQWLTNYIHGKGLRPGIWLVPNSSAAAVAEHPDWYLHYTNGKAVLDYNTPALDSTNPAVLGFLQKEMNTLDDWGFEYYKFDGEHAIPKYVPGVDLTRLYDKAVDPLAAYRNRLDLIRKTIGRSRFIEGDVAGTPLNGIGYIDSYFNGHDLYDNWQGMYSLFSSINANGFLNHIVAYTMPGEGMALEPRISFEEGVKSRNPSVIETERERELPLTGFGTTLAEARTVVSFVSLTGVAYSLGSIMPDLDDERVDLMRKTLPTIPIFPIDLFSRGTDMDWDKFKHTTPDTYVHNYPEILDLKVNAPAGSYDVVAMTNWRSWDKTQELEFSEKLGLAGGTAYVAFDFWNQKIYGVFKDRMPVEIGPHDTRVFQLHPLLKRPQLVGLSRHVSGAYSVLKVSWDDSTQTLSGSSQAVVGSPYVLWIYVPDGVSVSQVKASVRGNHAIPLQYVQSGNSLKLTFPGQQEPVDWDVTFGSKP